MLCSSISQLMRVLVTGAAGFVGRQVCEMLLDSGHLVIAAVRSPTVTRLDRAGLTHLCVGDLADSIDWRPIVQDVDAVVHLAAIAHRQHEDEIAIFRTNVDVTRAIGAAVALAGRRLVYVSSVKVHGDESRQGPFHEDDAFAPEDSYGKSKVAAEAELRQLVHQCGLRLTVLRPPLVYGPEVKANFLALLRAVDAGWPLPLANVRNRRSLIFVRNLADAILRCLEAQHAIGRTFLVADGEPVSTSRLIRALAEALGQSTRLIPFPPHFLEIAGALIGRGETVRRLTRSLEIDDSAIRQELGWQPPYTFEEGLRLTAEWYLAQRG